METFRVVAETESATMDMGTYDTLDEAKEVAASTAADWHDLTAVINIYVSGDDETPITIITCGPEREEMWPEFMDDQWGEDSNG